MAKRHHSSEHGRFPSEQKMEQKDAGMIKNDFSKFANLPTEVMMKPYAMPPAYMNWDYEDNIDGIDKQMSEDNSKRRSGMSPHKY